MPWFFEYDWSWFRPTEAILIWVGQMWINDQCHQYCLSSFRIKYLNDICLKVFMANFWFLFSKENGILFQKKIEFTIFYVLTVLAGCARYFGALFCKIQVRPQSWWSYPLWRPWSGPHDPFDSARLLIHSGCWKCHVMTLNSEVIIAAHCTPIDGHPKVLYSKQCKHWL